ncbi:MAG TPA: VOC family protein [Bryobacteraceae bacterium]|nr:VOC family protein [Bryobacteraceae bacterium]
MPKSVLFALACLPLIAAELKVDHATVAGKDLKAMQRALQAAGLACEYGGPHSNHATEMALTSFPDGSYLELIAIQPNADPAAVAAHEWHKQLESNGGPCAWAVRPADLGAEVARLHGAGVAVSGAKKNGRLRPDGAKLEWEAAQVGSGNGNFFPFLIHDFTPRERRAYPSGKPTTTEYTGVSKVVIGVKDLDASVAQFRRAYGFAEPERQDDPAFGAKLAWFRGTPVVLATPLSPQSWLDARIREFGETPCAFVLGRSHAVDARPSQWFGKQLVWADSAKLGWHLGFEAP